MPGPAPARRRRVVAVLTDTLLGAARPGVAAADSSQTRGVHGNCTSGATAHADVGARGTTMTLDDFVPWADAYFGIELATRQQVSVDACEPPENGAPPSASRRDGDQPSPGMSALREALRYTRRFPDQDLAGDSPERGWSVRERWRPRPQIDRAEGFTSLAGTQPDVWTASLVKRAYALLGPIARSPDAFDAALTRLAPADGMTPAIRRRLVVAAGLLGARGTVAAARRLVTTAGPHVVSAADLRAAALAAALVGREAASTFLRSPEVAALPYDLAERVGRMRRRVRAGMLLSVAAP